MRCDFCPLKKSISKVMSLLIGPHVYLHPSLDFGSVHGATIKCKSIKDLSHRISLGIPLTCSQLAQLAEDGKMLLLQVQCCCCSNSTSFFCLNVMACYYYCSYP